MEAKNKNILIGGLLAIVLVMAVGYAAFATQLNINGTANITSNWNVGFDQSKKSGSGVIDVTSGGSETPIGTINFTDAQNATLSANLKQPGDKIVYTFTILNTGTLDATLTNPVMSSADSDATSCSGSTCTKGNIKFTMTNPASSSLEASTGSTTMTVTAEFVEGAATVTEDESSIKITLTANQA